LEEWTGWLISITNSLNPGGFIGSDRYGQWSPKGFQINYDKLHFIDPELGNGRDEFLSDRYQMVNGSAVKLRLLLGLTITLPLSSPIGSILVETKLL
jgi:hypothetical protein